jgi:rubrerythrin
MMASEKDTLVIESADQLWRHNSRREFLRLLGIGGSVVLLPSVFAACTSDDPVGPPGGGGPATLNLNNDTGILNYAYALEQLEAGFYSAVVASSTFSSLSVEIQEVMVDLRNHEVIHRDFFARVLGGNAIGSLALNTSTVATATANRDSILRTAEQFEDLGVAAYNGAGKYLSDAGNLLIAGKIVSVEARHAAAIRDIRMALGATGTARFAGDDVVNSMGLDVKLEPSAVLSRVAATNFVTTQISIGTNPTGTATADAPPPTSI